MIGDFHVVDDSGAACGVHFAEFLVGVGVQVRFYQRRVVGECFRVGVGLASFEPCRSVFTEAYVVVGGHAEGVFLFDGLPEFRVACAVGLCRVLVSPE